MTFEQAMEIKAGIGAEIIKDEVAMRVWVTPRSYKDFTKYINDYRSVGPDDKLAKQYSTDGQYAVYGIWTNGVDVLFKCLV